ncbi:MAG TPA: methyltransferase domain-containing protein [Vicinamibacterales bacterium]|nr:methyltransferase domain-containing protein [Vicinamibacterales bacterium]
MIPRRSVAVALGVLLAAVAALPAAREQQRTHPVSGRRIANVMGHTGAVWLDRPEREAEEAPSKAIAALELKPGQTVADVGAGSGYYSIRLARAVGENGRVFATDIQPEMLALIRKKIDAARLSNIDLVLGTESDPRLPAGTLDLALMVDVYHELADPQGMLRALKRALKPGGRLVLIEFRKESAWVPIREEHKMSVKDARIELEAEGYTFDQVIDVLPWQHILVFRP